MPATPPSADTLARLQQQGYNQDACLSALLDATGSEDAALVLLRSRHPEVEQQPALPPLVVTAVVQVDSMQTQSHQQAVVMAVVPAGGLAQPAPLVMDVRL